MCKLKHFFNVNLNYGNNIALISHYIKYVDELIKYIREFNEKFNIGEINRLEDKKFALYQQIEKELMIIEYNKEK